MAPPHILRDASRLSATRTIELLERTCCTFDETDPEVAIAVADAALQAVLGVLVAGLSVQHPQANLQELLVGFLSKRGLGALDAIEQAKAAIDARR